MNTIRIRIRGRVQGVGYRRWFCLAAKRLNIRGWVRNRDDGSVEAEISGDSDDLLALEARCHQGPPGAEVSAVERQSLDMPTMSLPDSGVTVIRSE